MSKALPSFSITNWLFIGSILLFIVLKFPHLKVPFFWDESGVYGHMAFQLADGNLSLHPKAIDGWTSKGHPLLYVNYIASFCSVFGTNVFVAHMANFLLTLGLLVSVFIHVNKLFNQWSALWAAVLLMAVPLFFTQSVFILPEIGLTLALWWTSWAFLNRKYFHYFILGTIAIFIKEPALIWISALFFYDLIKTKQVVKNMIWLTPIVPFIIFLLIQKQTYGWYFFPYHTAGFDISVSGIATKLFDYIKFLFWQDARYLWLIIILLGIYARLFRSRGEEVDSDRRRTEAVLIASVCYLLFHATTFYGDRYIMPVIVVVSVCVGCSVIEFAPRLKNAVSVILLILLIAVSSLYMSSKTFNYDNDMSYLRSVKATKKVIDYMWENGMLVQDKFSATLPVIFSIQDPRFGYLPKGSTALFSRQVNNGTLNAVQVIPGSPVENPDGLSLDTLIKWKDHDIQTIIYKTTKADSSSVGE